MSSFFRRRGAQPFEYRPSYGEGYGKKGASAIAIVNLRTGTVSVLPQWTHVGQVVFLSNDELAFIQLIGPSRGIKYCFNRPSRIVRAALDGTNDGKIKTNQWPLAAAAALTGHVLLAVSQSSYWQTSDRSGRCGSTQTAASWYEVWVAAMRRCGPATNRCLAMVMSSE